jgi:pyruvate/2-oxoglutarate dehydrogenase complex dihydrolipoamide acyltransferase (E2) component
VWKILDIRGDVITTTLTVPKTGGIPTTKVRVVKWLKRVGEPVAIGEAVVELETDKVSYELESTVAGVLVKIFAEQKSEVPVGEALCEIGIQNQAR